MEPGGLVSVSSGTIADLISGGHSGSEQLDPLVMNLAASNARQWTLEDVSRSPASDGEVANAKREIDTLNAYRTRCIAELDALFSILVANPTAPPVTESPGSVIDRLTVLTIRLALLTDTASGDLSSEVDDASLTMVRTQYEQLLVAFDKLLFDLRSGERSYVCLPTVKVYRGRAAEFR